MSEVAERFHILGLPLPLPARCRILYSRSKQAWPHEILGSGEKTSPLTFAAAIAYAGFDLDF